MVELKYREEHESEKFNKIVELFKRKNEEKKNSNSDLFTNYDASILIHLSDKLPRYYYITKPNSTPKEDYQKIMDLLSLSMKETLSELGYDKVEFFDFD